MSNSFHSLHACLLGGLGVFALTNLAGPATQAVPASAPLQPAVAAATLDASDAYARAILAAWDSHDDSNPPLKHGPFLVNVDDPSFAGVLIPSAVTTFFAAEFRAQNLGDTAVEFTSGGAVLATVQPGTGQWITVPPTASVDLSYRGLGGGTRLLFVVGAR